MLAEGAVALLMLAAVVPHTREAGVLHMQGAAVLLTTTAAESLRRPVPRPVSRLVADSNRRSIARRRSVNQTSDDSRVPQHVRQ